MTEWYEPGRVTEGKKWECYWLKKKTPHRFMESIKEDLVNGGRSKKKALK